MYKNSGYEKPKFPGVGRATNGQVWVPEPEISREVLEGYLAQSKERMARLAAISSHHIPLPALGSTVGALAPNAAVSGGSLPSSQYGTGQGRGPVNVEQGAEKRNPNPSKDPQQGVAAASAPLSDEAFKKLMQQEEDRERVHLAPPPQSPLEIARFTAEYNLRSVHGFTFQQINIAERQDATGAALRSNPGYQEYKRELTIVNNYARQNPFMLNSKATQDFNIMVENYCKSPFPRLRKVGIALLALGLVAIVAGITTLCMLSYPAFVAAPMIKLYLDTVLIATIASLPAGIVSGFAGCWMMVFAEPRREIFELRSSLKTLQKEREPSLADSALRL